MNNTDYVLAKNQIINAMNDNSLIVFVGAGISANSNLPSWSELISEFKKDLPELNSSDYLRIAQYYHDTFGYNHYMQKIQQVFSKNGIPSPNELHKLIADIGPKHIITTNYDTLLEDQFSKGVLKYDVLTADADIPYAKSNQFLIKMHGDFQNKNIVLKEDDFTDYHKNFPMISNLLKTLVMNHTILFIGYSLSDNTFNALYRLIQSYFDKDAKESFLYTTDKISNIERDYFKRKKINFITNNTEESLNKVQTNYRFELTKDFLENLIANSDNKSRDSESLMNNLRFLDRLKYIRINDFINYSNFESRLLYFNGDLRILNHSESKITIEHGSELATLLDSKSNVIKFLDFKLKEDKVFEKNSFLLPAFTLYKDKEYALAKAKFRELANRAFGDKDYFNYLIAEFNFLKIIDEIDDEVSIEIPVVQKDLKSITKSLMNSTIGDEKKAIEYFYSNILNFNFLYEKLNIIDDYFDKIRYESYNQRKGGKSWNNLIFNCYMEVNDLFLFINSNCLCVEHYNLYKMVINRYFEILLISFSNQKYYEENSDNNDLDLFSTSSQIEKFDRDDIEIILSALDSKKLKLFKDIYNINKIKLTEDAEEFLLDKIREFINKNLSLKDNAYQELKKYCNFLLL
ncbi:TPA: SIR2 family protein [Streptococcus suis]|nr:SIR2 family protein [Streptococcus suis]